MGTRTIAAGCCIALFSGAASADIVYNGFSDATGLSLMGAAKTVADPLGSGDAVLRLTGITPQTVGTAWAQQKFDVGSAWEASITFRMSERGGPAGFNDLAGADGFALVIQNMSPTLYDANTSTLGGGIGYNQLGRLVAIEVDTWKNERAEDVNANHISVHVPREGNTTSHEIDSIGATTDLPEMSDGSLHTLMLWYQPGLLRVGIDGQEQDVLRVDLDIAEMLALTDGEAWVGFSSATGGCWENHDIYGWTMRTVPGPGGLAAMGGLLVLGGRRRR